MSFERQRIGLFVSGETRRGAPLFVRLSPTDLRKAVGRDRIPGGLADDKCPGSFDPQAVKVGAKVEREHSSDPAIQEEITRDHLTEDKEYYKKLARMEGDSKKVIDKGAAKNLARKVNFGSPEPFVHHSMTKPSVDFSKPKAAKNQQEAQKAIPGQVSASDPSVTQPRVSNPQAEQNKVNAAGHYMLADHFSRQPGPEAQAKVKFHNDQFHAHLQAGHKPEAPHFERARYQMPKHVASALGKSDALYVRL